MDKQCYDLHTHTLHSDGTLSAEELVARAVDKKVTVLAITDHDTLHALAPARQFILDNKLTIQLINGIEISSLWNKQEIHIVGLNIDADDPALLRFTEQQQARRISRARAIATKLAKKGFSDAYVQSAALAQSEIISRAHFARYLVNKGVVKDIDAAFKKYLSVGKVAYVAPEWPQLAETIAIIHAAKGQAVLAHPSRYTLTNKKLRQLIQDFKQAGGDAMEVAYSRQPPDVRNFLHLLSQEYGLSASQGSDFHSPGNWIELGSNINLPQGSVPIWHSWGNHLTQEN